MSDDTYFEASFDDEPKHGPQNNIDSREKNDGMTYSIARVFGYMFMWLAITTVICLGLAFFLNYLLTTTTDEEALANIFLGIIVAAIISGIGVIVMTIVTHAFLFKGKHSVAVPAAIYSVFMGVLMGVLAGIIAYFYANGWYVIGLSFGVTTLIFGIMALIGLAAKSKLNGLLIVGMGLFFGLLIMSGVMFIIMFFFPEIYEWWYWVLTLGLLAAVMLTTIWDLRNVKTLAEKGALNKNVSMYIAFNLYVDFIYILMRVLNIVLRIVGRAKR